MRYLIAAILLFASTIAARAQHIPEFPRIRFGQSPAEVQQLYPGFHIGGWFAGRASGRLTISHFPFAGCDAFVVLAFPDDHHLAGVMIDLNDSASDPCRQAFETEVAKRYGPRQRFRDFGHGAANEYWTAAGADVSLAHTRGGMVLAYNDPVFEARLQERIHRIMELANGRRRPQAAD